jgi:hypothetical protein
MLSVFVFGTGYFGLFLLFCASLYDATTGYAENKRRAVLDVQKSLFLSIELDFGGFRVARSFAECASAHSCKIWLGMGFCSE